ncbi:hypothetical protein SAMN05661010_02653 [Modicisalibacter muralis]|uniref:DUF1269 domain-containing protein n=1 Tax=Modicisalibacter muralis TaxID=119000 RepID=A0A1G9N5Y9_9GAMM|nr:DUF1269 domain-containing protein [Halomonas muralis]SDL81803.1 hypothetical protein SAMN05661010_02653 [Halomonas muralis]
MRRYYFLVPDSQTTVNIAHELTELGLGRNEVHVMGKDHDLLDKEKLNEATLIQTSDVFNAGKRGLMIGVPLGLVLGIVIASILAFPTTYEGKAVLVILMGFFGGLFGLWASTLVGVSVQDVKVEKFRNDLERGAFLMMVDPPPEREEEITSIIHRHHPEVTIEQMTPDERHHAEGEGH